MKELSIEEKARSYDEALEKARKLCAYPTSKPFISDLQDLFPELKESEDERIRKEIVELIMQPTWKTEKEFHRRKELVVWLEKQGKQKSVDKVELKFKVGEWVVFKNKHQSIYQVEKIEDGYYNLRHTHGGTFGVCVEHADSLRLWTIEDAKDGDVLEASDGSIFIYKCQRNNSVVHYIAVTSCNDLAINENDYSWENKNACHPATKEQRDCLFQRIKEDGYEWDADKKELKKL